MRRTAADEPTTGEDGQPLPDQDPARDEDTAADAGAGSAQPAEDSNTDSAAGATPTAAQAVDGMTQLEARALLDSLQQGEQLLPFIEQGNPRSQSTQDW